MAKKPFVNPLTRSSEDNLNLPAQPESKRGEPVLAPREEAKEKKKAFEDTHQRFTAWVDKDLKRQFDDLAAKKGMTKSALLDEAITALLHRQERKPYTRRAN